MKAKFKSICDLCHEPIMPGTQILITHGSGWAHDACTPNPPPHKPILINSYFDANPTRSGKFRTKNIDIWPRDN